MLGLSVGLTEDEMASMDAPHSCASFDDTDRLVLRYSDVLSRDRNNSVGRGAYGGGHRNRHHRKSMKTTASIALVGLVLSGNAAAAPSFVNGLAIPGASGDQFGTSVNDGRVGFFSDLYYDSNRSEWWGLSDRGPGGGPLSYETRMQRFTLDVDMNSGAISNFEIALIGGTQRPRIAGVGTQ